MYKKLSPIFKQLILRYFLEFLHVLLCVLKILQVNNTLHKAKIIGVGCVLTETEADLCLFGEQTWREVELNHAELMLLGTSIWTRPKQICHISLPLQYVAKSHLYEHSAFDLPHISSISNFSTFLWFQTLFYLHHFRTTVLFPSLSLHCNQKCPIHTGLPYHSQRLFSSTQRKQSIGNVIERIDRAEHCMTMKSMK